MRYIHFNPNEQNKKLNFKNIHKQNPSIGKIIVEFKTVNNERIETNENDNNSIPITDNIFTEKRIPVITYDKYPQYSEKEKLDDKNNIIISESNNNHDNIQNELNYNNNQININNNEIKQFINISNNSNIINNNLSNKREININFDKGIETDDNIIDNQDDVFELENNTKRKKKNINVDNAQIYCEKNKYINENGNMANNSSEINNILSDNNIHIDSDNNIISEKEKNLDYMVGDHSESKDVNMNYGEEEFEEPKEGLNDNFNEQNNYDENKMEQNDENNNENYYESNEDGEHYEYDEMNGEEHLDQFNEGENLYVEGVENEQVNGEENEEEDEELLERDRFEQTIIQPIGEDIIQIESYPIYFYEENAFCDYEYIPEEMD
jgi:hypothetical protein